MIRNNTARFLEGSEETEIHPDVRYVHDNIFEIVKTRHSAFLRTSLEEKLRQMKINTVVICGYSTNKCVGLTAIDAFERDFNVLLAEEAILGTNYESHCDMLKYLRQGFEIAPIPIDEICRILN